MKTTASDRSGTSPRLRRLLTAVARNGAEPVRHLKIGSIIVREHQGVLHEVMVAPDGFCWQGKTYSSLSTIALRITGTSWNGSRFFGLRDAEEAPRTRLPIPTRERLPPSRRSRRVRHGRVKALPRDVQDTTGARRNKAFRTKTPAVRDLHAQVDRAQSRSGLQLARRPARGL